MLLLRGVNCVLFTRSLLLLIVVAWRGWCSCLQGLVLIVGVVGCCCSMFVACCCSVAVARCMLSVVCRWLPVVSGCLLYVGYSMLFVACCLLSLLLVGWWLLSRIVGC